MDSNHKYKHTLCAFVIYSGWQLTYTYFLKGLETWEKVIKILGKRTKDLVGLVNHPVVKFFKPLVKTLPDITIDIYDYYYYNKTIDNRNFFKYSVKTVLNYFYGRNDYPHDVVKKVEEGKLSGNQVTELAILFGDEVAYGVVAEHAIEEYNNNYAELVLKDQVNASDAKALFEVINVDKDGIEESESDSSETDESTDTSGESGNEDKNDDDTSFDDDADESDSDGDNDENQETDPSNVDRTEQEIDYSYACVDHNIHNVTNEKHPYYCDPMLSWLKSDHALYDNGSVSIIIEGSGFMCDASHERVYGEHKGYLCTDEITGDL